MTIESMDILWDDGERVLSRGQRFGKLGCEKLLVARPSTDQPLLGTLNRLTHEFALKEELRDEWAIRPIELFREGNKTFLILNDPGGEPLASMLGVPFETTAFLRLAISIAAVLSKLHQSGLVHKDIKPAHIFVNCDSGEARFTGFGLASRLPRERHAPDTIAGTLAYMAPEQTGRMNRSIDSRSDLYSFGIILYQMLTAELPFTASDPMEWVHCHIAKKPLSPSRRLRTVPEAISGIIMKLLAKTAEDRYQTAIGIERDLQRCLSEWELQRSISNFPLDEQGWSERLLIPEKLYGREGDVEQLVLAYGRVAAGSSPECVLVTGYSGIGKSSVVSELHKILVPSRGLMASGKFDQYKRDIPYSALVQALQGLVRTLLGKSDTELYRWRTLLLEALDFEGRLITDLIPELKLIIGEQPLVADLDPGHAQRRLLLVFERFIGAFAQKAHPLVLFLDDLQWFDTGTLELIEGLLTRSALRHFLLIGAYRDNEVGTDHPVMLKLQRFRNSDIPIHEITLTPLAIEHVEQLISDALHMRPRSIKLLAQLVFDKTAGNPFFVIWFLHSLAEEKLLNFDHERGQWRWDTDQIHAKGYTDNVVDLMIDKLNRLPTVTLQALQHMACLGNAVDISTLATVMVIPRSHVHKVLGIAIRQELIERVDGLYLFAHDRVHEATYSLIPTDLLSAAHLKIGRILVAKTPAEKHEEIIFDIVGQLNRSESLITDPAEQEQLARFNLIAGQRSKASTAYELALKYFITGARLMGDHCWSQRHELKFKLELSLAECELLTGQLLVADQRIRTLAVQAITIVERGNVTCMLMNVNLLLDRNDQAVDVCLSFLRHVGVDWSAHPSDGIARTEYEGIWSKLGDQPIEQLIDLPPMEDAVALSTLHALTMLISPALHTDANLACLTICKAINLSLEYGNSDASSVAYANLSLVTGQRFGNYEMGFRFGQLGCQLVESRNLARYESRTYLSFALFVTRWAQPARSCRGLLDRAFVAANRIGDFSYGAFACNIIVSNLLFAGEPLPELQREAERRLAYTQKVKFGLVIDFIENQLALIRMLRGLAPVFGCLDSEHFNEREVQSHVSKTSPVLTCCYWIRKLQARYLAGDLTSAIEAGAQAQPLLEVSHSFLEEAEYYLYDALARAGLCADASSPDRQEHLSVISGHHMKLHAWTDICSDNFASHKALVGAEIARIENRLVEAENLYEEAISFAQQSEFVHMEALANEHASRFYHARGFTKIARLYMRDARYGYLRWGADGKVRQLEAVFKYLRAEEPMFGPAITIATPVEQLDLATVLKVSQAVSGEIVLEKLLDMIMTTAIEQAGAERGLMVSTKGNDPRIIAEATIGNHSPQLQLHLRDVPLSATLLPEGILYHVLRTHESVVLDDAISQPQYAADPYVLKQRSRSILCLPLMNQARLIGALFLENNLTAGVFSPSRIAVLKLVASQAAISLENAHLYRDVAESEAKIRRLVDSNIIGIIFWNADGEIIDANDAFLRMVGYEREDIGSGRMRWRDLTAPQYRDESEKTLLETLRNGSARPFEKEYIRKDGSLLPIIIGLATFETGSNEGVAFVLDLTERKHAQEEARQSEQRYRNIQAELAHANRVATMGQLAASIAHEVSQPIAATAMGAHAALRWLGAQPPNLEEIRTVLQNLIKDARRAADVLDRIRGHIRKAPPQKEAIEVAGIINEMVAFTRGQAISHSVSVQMRIAENLPSVLGDRIELQQVLLNLILNSFEAMNSVERKDRSLNISADMEGIGSVLVQVSDTGPGFDSGEAEQVFTAFYTTKATGLGMGLSICRSIIEAHGGRLWASSNQPTGAIIHFTLPPHTGA